MLQTGFLVLVIALVGWYFWNSTRGTVDQEGSLVHWMNLAEAQAENQRTHKPYMFDFTAAWCGPCRALNQQVFADAEAAEFINQSFIPVRVVDRRREEGRNQDWIEQLQARFRLEAFPTLGVDRGGEPITYRGYRGKEATLEFLKQSLGDKPQSF